MRKLPVPGQAKRLAFLDRFAAGRFHRKGGEYPEIITNPFAVYTKSAGFSSNHLAKQESPGSTDS